MTRWISLERDTPRWEHRAGKRIARKSLEFPLGKLSAGMMGVYVVYAPQPTGDPSGRQLDVPYYIGSSTDLKLRLTQHKASGMLLGASLVKIKLFKRPESMVFCEVGLIRRIQPATNKRGVKAFGRTYKRIMQKICPPAVVVATPPRPPAVAERLAASVVPSEPTEWLPVGPVQDSFEDEVEYGVAVDTVAAARTVGWIEPVMHGAATPQMVNKIAFQMLKEALEGHEKKLI